MDQQSWSGQAALGLIKWALKMPGGRQALSRLLQRDRGILLRELIAGPLSGDAGEDRKNLLADAVFGPAYEQLLPLLLENGFARLRALVRQAGSEARRALLDDAPADWNVLYCEEDYRRFFALARSHNDAPVRWILNRQDHALLKALSAEDERALFRTVALSGDSAPLKAILFRDDYRILANLLARNACEALKSVVLDGENDWFALLARARHGQPLAELLFAENATLLRSLCRLRGDSALEPILRGDGHRIVRALPQDLKNTLAGHLLREGALPPPEMLSESHTALAHLTATPRAEAVAALTQKWQSLAHLIPRENSGIAERFRAALGAIQSPDHVRGRVLDAITEGNIVHLAGASLQFPCRHSLWTLIHEILLNEDYYFECDTDAPVIIDGGAHMGMAIYYLKRRFPNARITAFEPEPMLRAMLEANIACNGFHDVLVRPHALAGERKTATFHISDAWSMAGSLSNHRASLGDALSEITVECEPLSPYLDEPVDFLKLDIEGAEAEVLEEAAPKLKNVRHLFCEFHQGPGLPSGRLVRMLNLLEDAGFEVQIGKSHNYQETSRRRPFLHVGKSASLIIWAKQRG